MAGIDDTFYLTTLDQLHTLADPLRVRILDRLVREPMTVKMLGTDLEEAPAKVHYHVRELERVGIIRLVETREKGGVLEKYYRAVSSNFQIAKDLLYRSPPDERTAIVNEYFQGIQSGVSAAVARYNANPDRRQPLVITNGTVWATSDEFRALLTQIDELAESYGSPRNLEGEQEWTINTIGYSAERESAEDVSDQAPVNEAVPPRIRRCYIFAAHSLTRRYLEAIVAQGNQLDLVVVGVCSFADDVTPELADLAILRIRVYGAVHASPEVRAVLQRKGGQNHPNPNT